MKKLKSLNLYQKVAWTIVLIGLVPMAILVTFISGKMIKGYRKALSSQYEQAAVYVTASLSSALDSYNTISKTTYSYNFINNDGVYGNYRSYDELRKIIYGEVYEGTQIEAQRQRDMENFLKNIASISSGIVATHFVASDTIAEDMNYHWCAGTRYFKSEPDFFNAIDYDELDTSSNQMMLIPTHRMNYLSGDSGMVYTVARNYFDIRGEVGKATYVGTLFIDVDIQQIDKMLQTIDFSGGEEIRVINEESECFYSTDTRDIGKNIAREMDSLDNTAAQIVLRTDPNNYGLSVVVTMDTEEAFANIRQMQKMMYLIIAGSVLALFGSSRFFSRKLTEPIHNMMEQMKKIESGNFDIQLPVNSTDEIGVLSERFNKMSAELKTYINESFVAKIRQNEAELTALKSQIYPHFLYNTLEIIRMTALDDTEHRVPEMIESLSEQIHYLIGPMQDMVTLQQEIDIIRKYVYLLNCRITGKVQLMVNAHELMDYRVPKLVLQPIVENAYVHGIKQKKQSGSIMIEAVRRGGLIEISVIDNGVGMDAGALDQIHLLLEGDEPGIKNEYNWQSIGLKNVHDRIRFLYGESYGIDITSTEGVGTIVRIVMPDIGTEKGATK